MTHRNGIRRMARTIAQGELAERQAAEREAQGLELYPLATWHAFAPDQLADVITGVTRSDPAFGQAIAARLVRLPGGARHEFGTERRDLSGALIGGALWRAERDGVSAYVLHLLQAEPCGVA
jgi:hypothetical protein